MSQILAPFQLLELNVISAQDIAAVGRNMRTYAVSWVHPDRKLSTRVDTQGHTNPTWNDKFVFRVDDDFLCSETSAIMIEIYALHWFKDIHVGTVRVLVGNLAPPPSKPFHDNKRAPLGMRFVALQVRRPSGRPQGILNIGFTVLDSSMRSMPLYTLNASAVGYRHLMGEKDAYESHNHMSPNVFAAGGGGAKPELRRTKSDTSSMIITAEAVARQQRASANEGRANSAISGSEVGEIKNGKKKKKLKLKSKSKPKSKASSVASSGYEANSALSDDEVSPWKVKSGKASPNDILHVEEQSPLHYDDGNGHGHPNNTVYDFDTFESDAVNEEEEEEQQQQHAHVNNYQYEVRPSPKPQFRNSPAPQFRNSPAPQFMNSPKLQFKNSPAPQYMNSPKPQFKNSPAPQYMNSPAPKFKNSPAPQYMSSPAPQFKNSPAPHYMSSPAPKFKNSPAPQYMSSPKPQFKNSPAPQYMSSPAPQFKNSPAVAQFMNSPKPQFKSSPMPQFKSSPMPQFMNSPKPQFRNPPAVSKFHPAVAAGLGGSRRGTPVHPLAKVTNGFDQYMTPRRSNLANMGQVTMTESELGPSASEVAASIARKPVVMDEGDNSTVGGWSLDEISVEGLQSKLERWETDLAPVVDRSEYSSYPTTASAKTKSSTKSSRHSRRHTDGGTGGGLFSCFSTICGIQCSIVCGGDSKEKKNRRRGRTASADDNSSLL